MALRNSPTKSETVWRSGWEGVMANRTPMLVLWACAFALVAAYYNVPMVTRLLRPIFDFQMNGGWMAAVVNRVVFCGLLPGLFLLATPSIRPRRVAVTILANCVWMGAWGVLSNAFFTLQAEVFGGGRDFATLLCKVAVDKCVWSALLCVPLNSLFFFWEGRDFSFARCREDWPESYLRNIYLPILVADFMVWIPVQFAVYMFPLPLQIQLVGFAGAFWSLVGLATGARLARKSCGKPC